MKDKLAKPQETWSLCQLRAFLLSPGKKEGAERYVLLGASIILVGIFCQISFLSNCFYEDVFFLNLFGPLDKIGHK